MQKEKIINTAWYRCPYCYNYSLTKARCCGKEMIEVDGENEQNSTGNELDYELKTLCKSLCSQPIKLIKIT